MADKIFRGKQLPSQFDSRVQHFGEIFDSENRLIDQVVLSVHRAPASYTGENLVEISCHGGRLVSAKMLETGLHAGAGAGTNLTREKTDLALRSATEQLEGRLGKQIREIRDQLVELLAHINASIDFPEEGITPDEGETLRVRL